MQAEYKPALLLIGSDAMLDYLLKRFAERGGFQVFTTCPLNLKSLAGVVFFSTSQLAQSQSFVDELIKNDIPIFVCCSLADEAQARELGADYCLFHPLTYNSFFSIASMVAADV